MSNRNLARRFVLAATVVLAVYGLAGAETKLPPPAQVAKDSDCFSCHALDHDVVGPAWLKVAQRYSGSPDSAALLSVVIVNGGGGHWGAAPMPAHPKLSQAEAVELAEWILSLKGSVKEQAAKTYTYKTADGKSVSVDFPVFKDHVHQVTEEIFGGYEKYDSYCFRCHGEDATGSEYAPDLRKSLADGMTHKQFFTIAMEGEKDKGMPEWAGFFTADELEQIYQYIKARQLDLLGPGRPPSSQD